MSLNESICDEQSESKFRCCCDRERSETSITIDSMTKWISSLEDSIQASTQKTEQVLTLILSRLDEQAAKNAELVRCNRILAEELSKRLYHAEFKQKKILNPAADEIVQGGLHPKVIPFVYLDKHQ